MLVPLIKVFVLLEPSIHDVNGLRVGHEFKRQFRLIHINGTSDDAIGIDQIFRICDHDTRMHFNSVFALGVICPTCPLRG
ncbi:hypothetical protein D3C76_1814620 [compost metagenome]